MKPGILTTEFWLVVLANALTQAGALDVPERWRWLITLATVTGYAISRGLAKAASTGDASAIGVPPDPALDDPAHQPAAEPREPTTTPAGQTAP